MCTALTLTNGDHYFGRTLDLDRSYGEQIAVLPRRFPLAFRRMGTTVEHYAMIGMATVMEGVPLFYDAANEHGLSMAGLNFPGNAYYPPVCEGKENIASFELIPWILSQCKSVSDARELLARINICDLAFRADVPPSPLHWMLADGRETLVLESRPSGLHIHKNPVGVMTNNPPFEYQLENLKSYEHLRTDNREVLRRDLPDYTDYCQGLGAVGLPGDLSSMSRFVRIAFGRRHAVTDGDERDTVGQFFHLLSSVEMIRGLCRTDEGHWDITVYTSCINASRGLYYYTTYGNRRIRCVDMNRTELDASALSLYPLTDEEDVLLVNTKTGIF